MEFAREMKRLETVRWTAGVRTIWTAMTARTAQMIPATRQRNSALTPGPVVTMIFQTGVAARIVHPMTTLTAPPANQKAQYAALISSAVLTNAIPKKGFAYSSWILKLFTLNTIYGGVGCEVWPRLFLFHTQFYREIYLPLKTFTVNIECNVI